MSRTPSAVTAQLVQAAAARLLTERGPGGLTIRTIAGEAGVSPQSIYNRFGSQDALLDDLATSGYRELARVMLADGPGFLGLISDPLDRLTELFARFRAFALADPNRYRFLFHQPMPGFDEGRSRRTAVTEVAEAEAFNLVVVVVRQAIEAGHLLPGDPTELTLRLFAAAHGAVHLDMTTHGLRGQTIDPDATMATMIRGLRPRRSLSSGSRR